MANATVEERSYLSWDTCEIAKSQAKFLQEENPELSDEEAFNDACGDSDLYTWEFDYLKESLTEELEKRSNNGRWLVTVKGFGWRGLDGYKVIDTLDGGEFLREILPDTECTFKIYTDKKDRLEIQNWHHDSPMGNEWYYITPALEYYLVEEAELLRNDIIERLENMRDDNELSDADVYTKAYIERAGSILKKAEERYERRAAKAGEG